MIKNSFLLVLLLAVSGCVSNGTHKEALGLRDAEITKLKDQLTGLTNDKTDLSTKLEELSEREKQAKERIAEFSKLTERFQKLSQAGTLSVKIERGRMLVVLSSDVLFSSGSSRLSTEGEVAIEQVVQVLKQIPDKDFQIEGHTDNVPIKTARFASNWELASARAISVLNTMLNWGLPSERVSVASFGDTKPIVSNETAEGKAVNRRIELVVVPDLSLLPGNEELDKLTIRPKNTEQ